jgi:filamentous hemagglutinin
MLNFRSLAALAVLIVIGLIAFSLRNGDVTVPSLPYDSAANSNASWSHGPDGSAGNAQEHWQKHGSEFPQMHSERDYVNAANAFVHHPPFDALIKHDARGDTLFYEPSTDTFAVMNAAGEPRTFFKPDSGARYWARQCCSN